MAHGNDRYTRIDQKTAEHTLEIKALKSQVEQLHRRIDSVLYALEKVTDLDISDLLSQ